MTNADRITTKEVYRLVEDMRRELRTDISKLDDRISKNYVTQEEFEPVKKLVYGVVGLILMSVVGALLALIIIK